MNRLLSMTTTAALLAVVTMPAIAQGPPPGAPPGGGPPPGFAGLFGGASGPPPGRAGARSDFTGNWVAVVSEDWRWRMITPPRGDYAGLPVNAEAKKIANGWNWARDEAAGEQCRAYAAPAIMREPGRLRISWVDDNTLKIETDAGQQTRLFHFGGEPGADVAGSARSWQGYSVAQWEQPPAAIQGNGLPVGIGPRAGTEGRTLEVVTTQIRAGYIRKNGVPFSANAHMKEYFDLFNDADGAPWFVVTTIVEDPQYLTGPWVTTSHFRKEPDGSKWNPVPCRVR